MLKGERLTASSSGALPIDRILRDGVADAPDVDCIATRSEGGINVLVWNYHDDDLPAEGAVDVAIEIAGLDGGPFLAHHHRMDGEHSNAHATFRAMGSPQPPSSKQYAELESAGGLALLGEPERLTPENGTVRLVFRLPRHAVSLISLVPA